MVLAPLSAGTPSLHFKDDVGGVAGRLGASMQQSRVEEWIRETDLAGIEYAEYWNNEEAETDKAWWVTDGDYAGMERYLGETGLIESLTSGVQAAARQRGERLSGECLDIAAGNCWAVPHLLQLTDLRVVHCLEYSRHRLLDLGPKLLQHYGVPDDRALLILGDINDIQLPSDSIDVAFLSQALHHAANPHLLLAEVRRALKNDGVAIIIGEHRAAPFWRRLTKLVVSRLVPDWLQRRLLGRPIHVTGLAPYVEDSESGDHIYTTAEYRAMFSAHRFSMREIGQEGAALRSFILTALDGGSPEAQSRGPARK